MESPVKKKKLHHHNIQAPSSESNNSILVQLILHDSPNVETKYLNGLRNQLGSRKTLIFTLKTNKLNAIPSPSKEIKCIRTCPQQNLLLTCGNNELSIIDLEDEESDKIIPNFNVKTFEVDDKGEFVYYFEGENDLVCRSIDEEMMIIKWRKTILAPLNCFTLGESKKEIYVLYQISDTDIEIHVLNSCDGEFDRKLKIVKQVKGDIKFLTLYHDEKEGKIYVNGVADFNSEEVDFLFIVDERSGKTMWVDDCGSVSMIAIFYDTFACVKSNCETVFVYDKKNLQRQRVLNVIQLQEQKAKFFDRSNNRLYYKKGGKIRMRTLDINSVFINIPTNRSITQSIERLGGRLPKIMQNSTEIPLQSLESTMLYYINFLNEIYFGDSTKLRYSDDELSRNFTFQQIGTDLQTRTFSNCRSVLSVGSGSEISKLNDFTINFHSSNGTILKSLKFTDLISNVAIVETVRGFYTSQDFVINYQSIYQNLLQKGAIDIETGEMNQSILATNYRNLICNNNSQLMELGRCIGLESKRIGNLKFNKMDLLAAASIEYDDGYYFVG